MDEGRRRVDEDVGEDHVDEDLGDEVSAMTSQQHVDDNVSLEGVPCGDQVSMRCVSEKSMKNYITFHTGLAYG